MLFIFLEQSPGASSQLRNEVILSFQYLRNIFSELAAMDARFADLCGVAYACHYQIPIFSRSSCAIYGAAWYAYGWIEGGGERKKIKRERIRSRYKKERRKDKRREKKNNLIVPRERWDALNICTVNRWCSWSCNYTRNARDGLRASILMPSSRFLYLFI